MDMHCYLIDCFLHDTSFYWKVFLKTIIAHIMWKFLKQNMLVFRKVCNFNLFKTNSTYFHQILYLAGNFINQRSAKFLLKKLSEIAKFENSRNRFDNFWFNSIQIYQNIRSSHREVVCIKRSSTKVDLLHK